MEIKDVKALKARAGVGEKNTKVGKHKNNMNPLRSSFRE